MSRRARLTIAGIPWHIIQRGHNRCPCFFADCDYQYYLEDLQKQAARFSCLVHAYVLMTNHVHLLLTPSKSDSASLMMKHLGQRYTQSINRRYQRSGTLWEGRFKSCLVQSNLYLLTCYRYIELNPVRAKMVAHPQDYKWSSFNVNAHGQFSPLITPHEEFLDLGSDDNDRRDAYRALFREPLGAQTLAGIREASNGNFVLGARRFVRDLEQTLGARTFPRRPGRPNRHKSA